MHCSPISRCNFVSLFLSVGNQFGWADITAGCGIECIVSRFRYHVWWWQSVGYFGYTNHRPRHTETSSTRWKSRQSRKSRATIESRQSKHRKPTRWSRNHSKRLRLLSNQSKIVQNSIAHQWATELIWWNKHHRTLQQCAIDHNDQQSQQRSTHTQSSLQLQRRRKGVCVWIETNYWMRVNDNAMHFTFIFSWTLSTCSMWLATKLIAIGHWLEPKLIGANWETKHYR